MLRTAIHPSSQGRPRRSAARAAPPEARLRLRVALYPNFTTPLPQALKRYKSSSRASETSDYEAMVAADQFFRYPR